MKRYRIIGGYCRSCPHKTACLPDSYKNRARFVYRNPNQDKIDRIRKRQQTTHFKKKLSEQRWKIEGLFGEAKENHCLRRARYRSLVKVQIQLFMTAIAQNLKRLVSRFISIFHHILYFRDLFGLRETLMKRFLRKSKLFYIRYIPALHAGG